VGRRLWRRRCATFARRAHPGPCGPGGWVGGVPRLARDPSCRTIFGVRLSLPNFRRPACGRRRGSGATVLLRGQPVPPIEHGTRARPGGRRTIFDKPARRRRSSELSPASSLRDLPARFGAPPRPPPLARAWAARDDSGSEPESEAQR